MSGLNIEGLASLQQDDTEAVSPQGSAWQGGIVTAFGPAGPFARCQQAYRPRAAQIDMALAVARAIEDQTPLVAEAGTGVGKTYAYLVPLLLSGQRALISTATKGLQDQLFLRDIPAVSAALSVPVTLALLKGRSSYLCLHRLRQARAALPDGDGVAQRTMGRIEQWAQVTQTGDLAELPGWDDRLPIKASVTSHRDNCLGSECPDFKSCHVVRARREALAADIVVVNHHLLFADMAVRETGMAELLPTTETVVIDEAHQLMAAGLQFFGQQLGTAALAELAKDVQALGTTDWAGLAPWSQWGADLEAVARHLCGVTAGWAGPAAVRLRWADLQDSSACMTAIAAVGQVCGDLTQQFEAMGATSPELVRLATRAQAMWHRAQALSDVAVPEGRVRWAERTRHHVRIVESPLDLCSTTEPPPWVQPGKAWVFVSATLGNDEALSWFTRPVGLASVARIHRYPSPFNYAQQACVYLPKVFEDPRAPGHPQAVADVAWQCAQVLRGRTFVLTTTLRALDAIAAVLRRQVTASGSGLTVLAQGDSPKRQLLAQFVAQGHSVLVGSHSFWEGIDVPGDALQCVIIDKLPFPPPTDALVEARVQTLKAQGRNAFAEVFIAEAAVALKQGAGRLIRGETDEGVLVVCDTRLHASRYGTQLRQALPPAPVLTAPDELLRYLHRLGQRHGPCTPKA